MTTLDSIYVKFNYPASAKLYKLAKAEGLTVTMKEVKDFLLNKEGAQIHTRKLKKVENPIRTVNKQMSYQMDLLDMTKFSTKNKGFKWILIVVDIFDRKACAEALKSKSPNDVVEGIKKCFNYLGKPKDVTSDDGAEWKGAVKTYLESENISHRTADVGDHNVLGIIDRFSKTLKSIIYKRFSHNDDVEWVPTLQETIKAYNATPHSSLNDRSPNEAEKYSFDTAMYQYRKIQEIEKKNEKKKDKINVGDNVRYKLKKTTFSKGYEQQWSNTIHKVISKNGQNYELDNGMSLRAQSLLLAGSMPQQIKPVEVKPKKAVTQIDEAKKQLQSERRKKKEDRPLTQIIEGKRERKPKKK